MGGQSVNWRFYEHIVPERDDDLLSLINIGSCNLHVISGGFKIGAKSN